MDIAENIKRLRKEKGITQKKLAEKSGLAVITIQNYEAGKYKPKIEQIKKLANALDVPVQNIMLNDYTPNLSVTLQVAAEITRVRVLKNISQEQLSKQTGISLDLIQQYESGTRIPKGNDYYKLALALDPDYKANFDGIADMPFDFFSGMSIDSDWRTTYDFLDIDENFLLNKYQHLNKTGKQEAIKRISELTEITKYIQQD